jgi:hypothetical protein
MKDLRLLPLNRLTRLSAFCITALLLITPFARAGLSLEMNVIRFHQYGYYFSPNLTTNNTAPNVTFGDYFIASFGYPTNGSSALYRFDTNGFSQVTGGSYGFGDFDGMIHELTNAPWSIYVTNSVTTNVYRFAVTANIGSNDLPYVNITFPTDGALNVTNQPTFTWQGPTNYNNLIVYTGSRSATLPVTQTSLLSPSVLYQGFNSVTPHYDSNSTTAVVASVPTNNAAQAIASWVSTAHLQDYSSSQFTVGAVDASGTEHALVARYAWDGTNLDGTAAGVDTSGNAYDMNFSGNVGSQGGVNSTTTAAAGPRAIQFHDGDANSAGYVGWDPTPAPLLHALAGSFTISCWIKTTQNDIGWDDAPAYYGAGIVSADNGGLANDSVPLALTGSRIGFNTGGSDEDVTLNSVTPVNDGIYHHIVVTRNQATGQKIIYIDGILDSFSSGITNLLEDPQLLTIGALSDASDPDANSTGYYNGYDGLLDDLQIYSGVLSSNEVAQLFANPGATAPDSNGGHQNVAQYEFENGTDTFQLGLDSSPHGNNLNSYSYWGQVHTNNSTAKAGTNAVEFFGTSSINANDQVLTNLNSVLAGSFSFSVWVKTTASIGNDTDNAYFGASIFWAYNDLGNTNDTIPLAITGDKAAFTTRGGDSGISDTLHSTTSVNDGNYHLITVTRNQFTGEKKIYVDGNFEGSEIGTTNPLNGNDYSLSIGGSVSSSYTGLLDDLQIYSGVLSGSDVAYLYTHPGSLVPDTTDQDFNEALNTIGLSWTTTGDANWFVESTHSHDNVSAAQSGIVTNSQTSTLQTTVTGPGTISFWWQNPTFDNLDLEFDIDGNYEDDLGSGNTDWVQFGPSPIPPGQHVLTWTVFANGDNNPADAAYLDEVTFIPNASVPLPVITVQPLDQTNYPGYTAALLVDSTNVPAPTWQWFQIGSGSILGATNKYYAPTNSGTPSVAGSYFAVATTVSGSTTSRTAIVTFTSAAAPPNWDRAFKAQLNNYNFQSATTNYGIACLLSSGGDVIYTANSFSGTNTFASSTLISGSNRFAAGLFKHYTNGAAIWGRAITNNGSGNSYPQCLAPAPGEGIYMSGVFLGTNGVDNLVLQETAGGSLYIVRFDAGGNALWARTFGGTNSQFQSYHQLVADPAGNVTISALGNNLVNFGATNLVLDGQGGILVQYDASGNIRWIQKPSGWVQYMTYDSGRIYVAFDGKTVNYIGGLTNISDRKWAVAALDATNGQALWVSGIGSLTNEGSPSGQSFDTPVIAVSGTNLFFAGTGWGSNVAFGPYSVSWPEAGGQYFARYDTSGNAQLAVPFGGTRVAPWVAKADASGNVFVAADFDGYASFGNKTIGAPHYDDIQNGLYYSQMFLAKFDRTGSNVWVRQGQSPVSYVNVRDLALAPDGIWADGFVNQYAYFGTNYVTGTTSCIGSPFCSIQLYVGGYLAKITESVTLPAPITLLHPQTFGTNFQFQFQSQSGFTHAVQYRTNLVTGAGWQTYSNVPGDGALKTIPIPISIFNGSRQGFIRISTQ